MKMKIKPDKHSFPANSKRLHILDSISKQQQQQHLRAANKKGRIEPKVKKESSSSSEDGGEWRVRLEQQDEMEKEGAAVYWGKKEMNQCVV